MLIQRLRTWNKKYQSETNLSKIQEWALNVNIDGM